MFMLVKEPLAWITVNWPGLSESGDAITHSIRVKCLLLPFAEMTSVFNLESDMTTLDLMIRVARDWQDVFYSAGAMACTADNIGLLIEGSPNFAVGFVQSYTKAWLGQVETREKNFASSPDDGRAEKAEAATTVSQPSAAPKA